MYSPSLVFALGTDMDVFTMKGEVPGVPRQMQLMQAVCDRPVDVIELSEPNPVAGCKTYPKAYDQIPQATAKEAGSTMTFVKVLYGHFSNSTDNEALIFTYSGFRTGLATLAVADEQEGWKRRWQGDLYPVDYCYPFQTSTGTPVLLCGQNSMRMGICNHWYSALEFPNSVPRERQRLLDTRWACGTETEDLVKLGYKESSEVAADRIWQAPDGKPGVAIRIHRTRWTGVAPKIYYKDDEIERHIVWEDNQFSEREASIIKMDQ